MKIRRLILSDFGKYHQQEFELSEGLNFATGANESGKTTLRRFIRSMLYGLERERGLKARSDDYTKYKPWEYGRFQGILEFEAEGKQYRLFRNFLTTEKRVSLEEMESGKTVPNPESFLREHGLLSEAVYTNTLWIGNSCKSEELLAGELKDYLANAARSGGAGLNLQKSLSWLGVQKKRLEKQLPEQELRDCMELLMQKEQVLKVLLQHGSRQTELCNQKAELERRICRNKEKQEQLGAELTHAEQEEEECTKAEQRLSGRLAVFVALFVIGLLTGGYQLFFAVGNPAIAITVLAVSAFFGVGACRFLYLRGKVRKDKQHFQTEKEICREQAERIQKELSAYYEELTKLLPLAEQERLFLEQTEERLRVCQAAEERYHAVLAQKREYLKEIEAIDLAVQTLQQLSMELYEEFGARFQAALSFYVKAFTDHAYERLTAGEDLSLRAMTSERSLSPGDVSYGTGEQFYLALRFAAADVFDPEKKQMVILDDSFASFDEQRLESAILALAGCKRQVLVLSSTGREERAAKQMGITYETVF